MGFSLLNYRQKLIAKLVVATLAIPVLFNQCSDVDFQITEEASQSAMAQGSISINDGAEFTNDLRVEVTIIPGELATQMYVTNASDCRSNGDWEDLADKRPWALEQENEQAAVYLKFRDESGVESPCLSDTIVHDDIPPMVNLLERPASYISAMESLVPFEAVDSGSGIDRSICQFAGKEVDCDKEFIAKGALGYNSLRVLAVDRAGNYSHPVSAFWYIDMSAPTVAIVSGPAAVSNGSSNVITFTAEDDLSGVKVVECRVTKEGSAAPAYSDCSSPFDAGSLAEGSYKFEVRASDLAKNQSDVATHSWAIDTTAPTVEITSAPSVYDMNTTAAFEFRGMDGGQAITDFKCKLDGGDYANCTSPQTYTGLAEGSHTFSVVGLDKIGNESSPVSYTWTIDASGAQLSWVQVPDIYTKETAADFVWAIAISGAPLESLECRHNGATVACTGLNHKLMNLAEQKHKFEVRAKDKAGNLSNGIEHEWTVDTTAPTVMVTGPDKPTKETTVVITVKGEDAGSGVDHFECKLDDGSYVQCPLTGANNDQVKLENLSDGEHTIEVVAVDRAGNKTPTPGKATFEVDSTPPVITYAKEEIGKYNEDTTIFNFNVTDNSGEVASIQCGFDGQISDCAVNTDYSAKDLVDGNHTFEVIAKDEAGNEVKDVKAWTVGKKPVDEVKDDCKDKPQQTMVYTMNFPAPNNTCDWGQNGNLVERNGYLQARIEQMQNFELPAESKICDVNFAFDEQDMRYDDHFMMTFNNYVIASSYDFSYLLLKSDEGHQLYDWSRIAGSQWLNSPSNSKEGVFCAGKDDGRGTCSWPATDTVGKINLSYEPEVIQEIFATDVNRTNHELKFISVGDNDEFDCEHSAVNFSIEVKYVQ